MPRPLLKKKKSKETTRNTEPEQPNVTFTQLTTLISFPSQQTSNKKKKKKSEVFLLVHVFFFCVIKSMESTPHFRSTFTAHASRDVHSQKTKKKKVHGASINERYHAQPISKSPLYATLSKQTRKKKNCDVRKKKAAQRKTASTHTQKKKRKKNLTHKEGQAASVFSACASTFSAEQGLRQTLPGR